MASEPCDLGARSPERLTVRGWRKRNQWGPGGGKSTIFWCCPPPPPQTQNRSRRSSGELEKRHGLWSQPARSPTYYLCPPTPRFLQLDDGFRTPASWLWQGLWGFSVIAPSVATAQRLCSANTPFLPAPLQGKCPREGPQQAHELTGPDSLPHLLVGVQACGWQSLSPCGLEAAVVPGSSS